MAILRSHLEAGDKLHVELQIFDDTRCCECDNELHSCQDCETFGGPGLTPGFPGVSGLRFIEVDGVRFIEQGEE